MNDRFFELPAAKQTIILNGAMSVFAQYDYKKATTDEIVTRAGISKGLLFHYFGSKKALYLYAVSYAMQCLLDEMHKDFDTSETDFFRMLVNAQTIKIAILRKHPDLLTFLTNAYLESDAAVVAELDHQNNGVIVQSRNVILARADATKFKPGVSMEKTLDLILWMSEGLMRNRTRLTGYDLEAIDAEYLDCLEMLRQNLYREDVLACTLTNMVTPANQPS